jgi:hypothetical protein
LYFALHPLEARWRTILPPVYEHLQQKRSDRFSLKLFTLTPGYCRTFFGKLSTPPLFGKKEGHRKT